MVLVGYRQVTAYDSAFWPDATIVTSRSASEISGVNRCKAMWERPEGTGQSSSDGGGPADVHQKCRCGVIVRGREALGGLLQHCGNQAACVGRSPASVPVL